MAYKPLNDWLDKHEGKKEGSSYENIQKERVRQGYKREKIAKKMKPHSFTKESNPVLRSWARGQK